MTVRLSGISKTFTGHHGPNLVLDDVTLEVPEGSMTVVVGPSGSGKTTLLRCVAGLEHPDHGAIEVGGRDVTALPPGERDVAMVFQDYALYPHLSVRDNIAFGLKARKVARDEVDLQVRRAADTVGLEPHLDRLPDRLSGGERQRVALARALVRRPVAFLLDEPLSNLDAELRARTRIEIRSLQRALETTTLYVTHDQVEALTMGDQIALLRDGRLEQVGDAMEVYERPTNAFVARFLGTPPMNLIPSRLLGSGNGTLIGVRPERMQLVEPVDGRVSGEVVAVEPVGADVIVHVRLEAETVLVRADTRDAPRLAETVGVAFADGDVHRFSEDGSRLA